MKTGNSYKTCVYILDEVDRIVSLSPYWFTFGEENQASEVLYPGNIINTSVWLYVDGVEAKYMYDIVMRHVRKNGEPVTFPFRCDSPDRRRYLEMTISPMAKEWLQFASSLKHEEARDTVHLLKSGFPRSEESITICSLCKKVELPDRRWEEIELATMELGLCDKQPLPMISHSLCPVCFNTAMASIGRPS